MKIRFKLEDYDKEIILSMILSFIVGWLASFIMISPVSLIKRIIGLIKLII